MLLNVLCIIMLWVVHDFHLSFVQVTTSDGDIEEDTIHCATCGVQVSLKKAMVHMEKCFMKVNTIPTSSINVSTFLSPLPVGGKRIIWWCSKE